MEWVKWIFLARISTGTVFIELRSSFEIHTFNVTIIVLNRSRSVTSSRIIPDINLSLSRERERIPRDFRWKSWRFRDSVDLRRTKKIHMAVRRTTRWFHERSLVAASVESSHRRIILVSLARLELGYQPRSKRNVSSTERTRTDGDDNVVSSTVKTNSVITTDVLTDVNDRK